MLLNVPELTPTNVGHDALPFLAPHGPVARDANSCISYDSKHAAGVCLGTIQARTHIQLALACQQSMLKVQHRLRFTMEHVYGHTGNMGNECADHGAVLGLVSGHNLLALACQQSMLKVQHRLRLTMQHVCGHTGNLGNECADHGAALGLVSSHNLSTRWARHTFDTAACFASCNNIW